MYHPYNVQHNLLGFKPCYKWMTFNTKILKKMLKKGYAYTSADGYLNYDLPEWTKNLIDKRRNNYLENKKIKTNINPVNESESFDKEESGWIEE